MLQILEKKFESLLGTCVEIKLTENTSILIKIVNKIDKMIIKINRNIAFADENVFKDILSFIKTGEKKLPNLKNFIKANTDLFKKRAYKFKQITRGKIYNLQEIFNFLNNKYFENSIKSSITWSKIKKGFVNKRILGSFDPINDIIRINPILDSTHIPDFYISFVVHHEMLHAFLRKNGNKWHSKEFKTREKNFEFYDKALIWEKRNLLKMLIK